MHTPGDGLLDLLAEVLQDVSRSTECLVWSNLEGMGSVRVWMTLAESEAEI